MRHVARENTHWAEAGPAPIEPTGLSDHGIAGDVVYLNHARMSPCSRPVLAAMQSRLEREYRYGWIEDDDEVVREAQAAIADLLGASAGEIAITQSATQAFNAIVNGFEWHPGDNVVVTDLVYRSMMMALLHVCEQHSVDLRVVRSHDLLLAPEDFRPVVDGRTRLVLVPMLPTFCGVLQPVTDIGQVVASSSEAHFVVNATQAFGQVAIDVRNIRCDFLFATSRKWLRGPRGVGFFFVRRELIPAMRTATIGYRAATWTGPRDYMLEESIDRFHAGDYAPVLFVGVAAATRYAAAVEAPKIQARNADLARYARERIGALSGITLHDRLRGTTGTLPITIGEQDADESVELLRREGIVACTIYEENNLLGLQELGARKLVRIALHYTNTVEDIDHLTKVLPRVLATTAPSSSRP